MRRRQRSSEKFDAIRLLDTLARARGIRLNQTSDQSTVLDALREVASQAPQNEILLHGARTQSMFAYVAGALGHCDIIKEEDAGELYSARTSIAVPDFRILTSEGDEFFVEVKNCHETGVHHRYRLTKDYLDKLREYANVFKRDLRIAIYWSRYKLWSLVSADAFEFDGVHYSLSMNQCMKRSEMRILGDGMVATVPPIIFRVMSDPNEPRHVDPDGKAPFTIGAVQFICGGRWVQDPLEQKLAWFLLSYGCWDTDESEAKVEDGQLIWMQTVAGKETVEGQEFATLGFLSQMISSQFNELTTQEGRVSRLIPSSDPHALGIVIPADFKGKAL